MSLRKNLAILGCALRWVAAVALLFGGNSERMFSQQVEAEALRHFQAARRAQDAGSLDVAEREYLKVIHLRPAVAESYASLGQLYYSEGKAEESARTLAVAHKLKPNLPGVSLTLGMDYIRLYQPARAVACLREAVRLEPASQQAQSWLATALWNDGKVQESLQQLDKTRQLFPSDPDILFLVGEANRKAADREIELLLAAVTGTPLAHQVYGDIYADEKAWDKAVGHYRRAIEQDAAWIGAHLGLGNVALHQGKLDEAEQDFRNELRVDPSSAPAKARLAEIAMLKGKTQDALDLLDSAIRSSPEQTSSAMDLPPSYATLGGGMGESMQEQLRNSIPALERAPASPSRSLAVAAANAGLENDEAFRTAWEDFRRATSQPMHDPSLYQHALFSFDRQEFEAAEADLHQWLTLHPKDQQAHYLLARTYRTLSLSALDRLFSVAPDSYRAHQLLAQTYANREEKDKALAEYRIVEHMNPDLPGLHFTIGHLLRRMGDSDKAMAEIGTELKLNPANAEANAELGSLLVAQHEPDKAVGYLMKALKIEPNLWFAHQELGKAYYLQRDYAKAEAELRKATQSDLDGSAHYQLGMVYRALGRVQAANEQFTTSQKIKAERLSEATLDVREAATQ